MPSRAKPNKEMLCNILNSANTSSTVEHLEALALNLTELNLIKKYFTVF